jgi:hypothetical protein
VGAAAAGALSPAGGGGGAAADTTAAVGAAGAAVGDGDDGDGGLFAAEVPAAAAAAKLVGFGAGGLVGPPALVAEDAAESIVDWGRGAALFPAVVDFAELSFATVDTSMSPNLS